ncbi:MAG: proprotein convertase P-domain-containing protein, partial [Myxococcota bacterium]
MRGLLLAFVRFSLVFAMGCVAGDPEEPGPSLAPLVDPGSVEEAGILAFLNDASTTFTLLDIDVALDRRAARNLVDERPFASFAEVDAVPYVGSVALQKILTWALENGWVEENDGDRDGATLALLNDEETTFTLLDDDVGLDRRAAQNLMDTRAGADGVVGSADDVVFVSIAQVDAVSYVGPAALDLLATYALSNGYGSEPVTGGVPCAIISEVLEGPGRNNKAVEVFNCGPEALSLDQLGICLVRNDDTTCSSTATVGSGSLASGEVWVTCRTRTGEVIDPYQPLIDACDAEIGGTAIFNGDDRLMLFHDADANGSFDGEDVLLDTFGDPNTRPADTIWAELSFRRCNLEPFVSGDFDVDDHYTRHGSTSFTHLGTPPQQTCGPAGTAGEGEPCLDTMGCAEGLRCFGRPNDGSSPYGQCVDPTPIPGEGDLCDRFSPCNDGLVCAGWTIFGEGICVPQWMAGRYRDDVPEAIPAGGTIERGVVVSGLASVPVDIEVTTHIVHPRLSDLRVILADPNGTESILWDRTSELEEWSRSFALNGISRDDEVNGRWTLRV